MIDEVRTNYETNAFSFVGKIEFYDNSGERFSILVTGCSDNSYFTNYPFIRKNRENGTHDFILSKNKSVNFMNKIDTETLLRNNENTKTIIHERGKKQNLLENDISKKKPSSMIEKSFLDNDKKCENSQSESDVKKMNLNNEIEWKSETIEYLKTESYVILKWLNKFVCKKQFDVEHFPECILNGSADIFVDFIAEVILRSYTPNICICSFLILTTIQKTMS